MNESSVERRLVKRVREMGGKAYKWVSPGNAGVPDRIVILPGGVVLAVEVKRPGGKTSKLQDRELARLQSLGVMAVVVDSYAAVDDLLARFDRRSPAR